MQDIAYSNNLYSNLFAYSNNVARITIDTLMIPLSMAVKESGLRRGAAGAVIVT